MKKFYLVGSGPGNKDYITLKALKTLKNADVVLYDALANKDILDYCKSEAKKIFVGKRKGFGFTQDNINNIIIYNLERYDKVVRLKGGDPYVFGRGFEEYNHVLENSNATIEYIPGVSSFYSAAGLNNIPITYRGVSDGFWVLPGVNRKMSLPDDIIKAAKSNSTVIILMPLMNFEKIIRTFLKYRDKKTGVTLIGDASLKNQKTLITNLQKAILDQKNKQIKSPATLIIGKVVNVSLNKKSKKNEQFISSIY